MKSIINVAAALIAILFLFVAAMLLIVALTPEAKADDVVPFETKGIYGVNGEGPPVYVLFDVKVISGIGYERTFRCTLDTAATQLWLSMSQAQRLGYHPEHDPMVVSGQAYGAYTARSAQVGSVVKQAPTFYVWSRLGENTCLVGMDFLKDNFGTGVITFDFNNRVILAGDNPTEDWHEQWSACAWGLNACMAGYYNLWSECK